ncbi:MAG: hypothetical protein JO365_13805 [Bradyrhizobium sp.]|nr:hypothetical protein [Bradyrhizobium sp.]
MDDPSDRGRRAERYQTTAFVTCIRADIHDPVAVGGHAHVMLHHDDGIAGFVSAPLIALTMLV